ncbi:hypothetical protein F4604DRAFT_1884460 [Suillus subluteus]|nr:hypothetical protein F4604DRAFT_1884460 [Suillus subluteus]
MTPEEKCAHEALQERNWDDHFDDNGELSSSILDGSEPVDISHAGSEFFELTREMMGDFWNVSSWAQHPDYRTRRNRTQRRTEAFDNQMPVLIHAYLDWHLVNSATGGQGFFSHCTAAACQGTIPDINAGAIAIKVVDMFYTEKVPLTILTTDFFIASALFNQGVVPCSPISPSMGVTIESLNFYHIARQHNPHFSIQAYVKTMCDLQGVQFYLYLSRQFSIALDDPNWRLKHCCPACTYTLHDEHPLKFKILFTMDVLKRLLHDLDLDDLDGMESRAMQHSSDLPTAQCVQGDHYLSREYVESFRSNDSSMDMLEGNDEDNPCIGRWKNMRDDKTKRMWGVFDKSGIFLAVCHHGFSLLIVDMIQSGEQVKYPQAIVSKLLDVFGKDLGGSYDIGCRFKTTLHHSILGQCARKLNYTSLVGAFHGHAHQQLCQLDHLATYVKGLGLEDLEGCERTFSKSNALTSSHNDEFKIYANLTTFLYNTYKQALDILHDGQQTLPKLMHELGVTDESVFDVWLDKERNYLLSLSHEPECETLQTEYWQKLVNLSASKMELNTASVAWAVSTPSTMIETARRHAIKNYEKDLKMVQELEGKLDINQEWRDTGCLVANRKFQRALDHLEGLVVARIFELSKMNQAGTGYKLQKHIGKALQARSAAICTALDHYNAAARSLSPPRPSLTWEEVVEYAFLSNFDLLRDARQDVSQHPWATPTGHLTMDTYFKMRCAWEEIQHLNVEIRRVATYLHDESKYLLKCKMQLKPLHPALAHQVSLYHKVHARFTRHHLHRLHKISMLKGFMGSIIPGTSIEQGPGTSTSFPTVCIPSKLVHDGLSMPQEGEDDLMEDLEEEEDTEVDGPPPIHNALGKIDELAVVHSEHKGLDTDVARLPLSRGCQYPNIVTLSNISSEVRGYNG